MTDEADLHAYAVTLVFGPLIVTNMSVAPNEVMATALATAESVRMLAPAEPLSMLNVALLEPVWLRAALRAIETGNQPAQVLSLVPKEELPRQQAAPRSMWCGRHHVAFEWAGSCYVCAAEDDAQGPPAA